MQSERPTRRPYAGCGCPATNAGTDSGVHDGSRRRIPWHDRLAALRAAFPLTLPVCAAYVFLGMTYGMLMVTAGFPAWLPVLTALVVYTGSLEFLLVDILASPFNPVSTLVTAVVVGARHLFYGISMLGRYRGVGAKKPYLIYTTSDETFSVNYAAQIPEGIDHGWYYFWVSLLDQMYWVAGAGIGALCGSLITVDLTGLDFVMTAMFAVILLQQCFADGTRVRGWAGDHISELVGVLGSAGCLAFFGPDHFIVPSMVVILTALLAARNTPQMRRNVARDEARQHASAPAAEAEPVAAAGSPVSGASPAAAASPVTAAGSPATTTSPASGISLAAQTNAGDRDD